VIDLVNKALAEQEQIGWAPCNAGISQPVLEHCYFIESKIEEGQQPGKCLESQDYPTTLGIYP
jgi:hypothetical protein